jgi:hypothetical protein
MGVRNKLLKNTALGYLTRVEFCGILEIEEVIQMVEIVPIHEQEAEAKRSEQIEDDEPEVIDNIEPTTNKHEYLVVFTYGQSHVEMTMHEGSMKVALGRAFTKFKSQLPKRTRLKEVNIQIKFKG